jgi:hypothetical protein
MPWWRKREPEVEEPIADSPEAVQLEDGLPGIRSDGPWDASEKDTLDDPAYVDLGSLRVRGRPGFNLQMPADDDEGTIGSVVLVTEESGLELRAFAAAKSGGLWDDVRSDLEAEAEQLGAELDRVDGSFGTELRIRIPVTTPEGEEVVQPSRIIGIEGPRWMLRATFLGREALEPADDSLLMAALRDVVVVRGEEPRAPRAPLLLRIGGDFEIVDSAGPDDTGSGSAP